MENNSITIEDYVDNLLACRNEYLKVKDIYNFSQYKTEHDPVDQDWDDYVVNWEQISSAIEDVAGFLLGYKPLMFMCESAGNMAIAMGESASSSLTDLVGGLNSSLFSGIATVGSIANEGIGKITEPLGDVAKSAMDPKVIIIIAVVAVIIIMIYFKNKE